MIGIRTSGLAVLTSVLFFSFSIAQEKPAYVLYNSKGKKVDFGKLEKSLQDKEFIFFGEYHNNPIAHWLQLELTQTLYKKHGNKLVIGAEMFEQDNQNGIDLYLTGFFSKEQFKDSVRFWSNYNTDYKPVLEFAKENKLKFIATNIPRKYASMVFKKGVSSLDSLSEIEKKWICPLPFEVDTTLSQYAALLDGEMHMGKNFVYAQAIKDATMAYFIVKNKQKNSVFYHLNGSYHSDYFQGILWYVNYYSKADYSKMLTISVVEQENIQSLEKEYLGKANFIICVPENMTKTH
jgi:uncharacterized iron-regulated protein